MRDSIRCQVEIRRGNSSTNTTQLVATTELPCASLSSVWTWLINDAIDDYVVWSTDEQVADVSQLIGTYLFNSGSVANRVHTGGATPIYGQYQLVVTEMRMDYCALRRTSNAGTSTGIVAFDSLNPWFEGCTNGADDNGNGMIDCADTLCASAENCKLPQNNCVTQKQCLQTCTSPVNAGNSLSWEAVCQSFCASKPIVCNALNSWSCTRSWIFSNLYSTATWNKSRL